MLATCTLVPKQHLFTDTGDRPMRCSWVGCDMKRVLLLVGSPRGPDSTSQSLGGYLLERLAEKDHETKRIGIYSALRKDQGLDEIIKAVEDADLFILAFPLYIDSLPAAAIFVLESIAEHRKSYAHKQNQSFVAVCNCGFPEAEQMNTALAICKRFAKETGFQWFGALALGGGEAIHGRALKEVGGMARNIMRSLDMAAVALANGQPVPEEATKLMAKPFVPALLYRMIGNSGWKRDAKKYGVRRHLNDQPYQL